MNIRCPFCRYNINKQIFRNHYHQCYLKYSLMYIQHLNKNKYNPYQFRTKNTKISDNRYKNNRYKNNEKMNDNRYKNKNIKNNEKISDNRYKNNKNNNNKEKISDNRYKNNKNNKKIIRYNKYLELNYNYNNTEYENMFSNLLYNKRVVIVGPSSTIVNSNQCEYIDKCDVVIRLNRAVPINKKLIKDIGSKTTIIYTNLDNNSDSTKHINFKKFIKNNIKFICSPYPPIEPFKKDIDNYLNQKYQLPFHHFPFNDYLKIKSVLGCRPYTGMSAILDILRYKIKSLYVTGIDFYANDYYKEYRGKDTYNLNYIRNNKIHNSRAHLNFIKYMSLTNDKLILDPPLKNIIYKRYNYVFNKLYSLLSGCCFKKKIEKIKTSKKIHILFNSKKINEINNIEDSFKILIYPNKFKKINKFKFDIVVNSSNDNIDNLNYINEIKNNDFTNKSINNIIKKFNEINIKISNNFILLLLIILETKLNNNINIYGLSLKSFNSLEEKLFFRYLDKRNIINNVN